MVNNDAVKIATEKKSRLNLQKGTSKYVWRMIMGLYMSVALAPRNM